MPSPHDDLRDALVAQALRELPADWPTPPGLAGRLMQAALDEQLSRVADQLFGHRFARACPVAGQPPAAYQHRILPAVAASPTLLAGIRFKGGPRLPFVELMGWTGPIQGERAWNEVRARILAEFAPFAPRRLRLRWPGAAPPPVSGPQVEVDLRLVAGRLEQLRQRPRPWGEEALEVQTATDLSFFADYARAHARWRAGSPRIGPEVFPAQEEQLRRCLTEGVIVTAHVRGRWAGLMAASREPERALEGYSVQELFLDEGLRGRRNAAILQRRLVDRLLDHGRDCLHGTIHRSNLPSLRAAQRTGRRVVETWWFL